MKWQELEQLRVGCWASLSPDGLRSSPCDWLGFFIGEGQVGSQITGQLRSPKARAPGESGGS